MYNNIANNHATYFHILQSRKMNGLEKNRPLWKFKLTDAEYESLKQTLRSHRNELYKYGIEAALCYAEWWRRDYKGNVPSKEDVSIGIGLHCNDSDELYMAARSALKRHGYTFIHSLKGTEYFRTLLNQGGLPVNYIKNSEGNLSNFSRFLKGLVRELSTINVDWNSDDHSIIQQFSCTSYLGNSFKNSNIYDVAMQIVHAIIEDDNTLLPYDDTDTSLSELTKVLKNEYTCAKRERRVRPLSLHWKLYTTEEGVGWMFVNLDSVQDISSDSIPGLNNSTCYSFDVFVAGTLVGKYVRKSINRNEEGEITDATYTRISVGTNKDILWKGEPVVEVKVRCDNDDRIFLTIAGCYPPNFEYPQVFQMLDDGLYCQCETANAENNIAVFTAQWKDENSKKMTIENNCFYYREFTDSMELKNSETMETFNLTNKFTSHTAEFTGNYIPWVEKSNYKLLAKIPTIRVYDKDKKRVDNKRIKTKYRFRNNKNSHWLNLHSACVLSTGLVDICVEFPDGQTLIETFYFIGDLNFSSSNEALFSTEVICSCDQTLRPKIEKLENIQIEELSSNKWQISRNKSSAICPSLCHFRIYNLGNPTLRLSVAIPFDGIMITDVYGNIVPNQKIISFNNLAHYFIISHGGKFRQVNVSYFSEKDKESTKFKQLKSGVIDGLVSLADYHDLIMRMFNLYGANSFDRSSSVMLNVSGTKVYIRKFVLESTIEEGKIRITDSTEDKGSQFIYEGSLYAFAVGEELATDDFFPIKLERDSEAENLFSFPDDFTQKEVVVFSGPEVKRRIIPKYYNREENDYDKDERSSRSSKITNRWYEMLHSEDVMTGKHWPDVCKAYAICSQYNLPFTTYNGLKSIASDAKLMVKFVIAMWLNEYKDVLIQDIDRFEQEMVTALHWVPCKLWEDSINEFMAAIPEQLKVMMMMKMESLIELLQALFNSTLSTDIASDFATYLVSGELKEGRAFTTANINDYKMKIHGLSDTNIDLPLIKHKLTGRYYPPQDMLPAYKVMIESAMCAAENVCAIENCTNLFSSEKRENARVVNFYRKYFKETYSDIFFKTVKYRATK